MSTLTTEEKRRLALKFLRPSEKAREEAEEEMRLTLWIDRAPVNASRTRLRMRQRVAGT